MLHYGTPVLRGLAMIVLQHAAKSLTAIDLSGRPGLLGERDLIPQSLMIALSMIMLGIFGDRPPQSLLVEYEKLPQALALDREYESLSERVEIRTARWQRDEFNARTLDDVIERRAELAIIVVDQVLCSAQESYAIHGHVRGMNQHADFGVPLGHGIADCGGRALEVELDACAVCHHQGAAPPR